MTPKETLIKKFELAGMSWMVHWINDNPDTSNVIYEAMEAYADQQIEDFQDGLKDAPDFN